MFVVGADAMVLVEGVARPLGPEHAVDTQLRALCTETRARYAFPSLVWGDADSTICPECLDAVTTPGFEEEGIEAPAIEASAVEEVGVESEETAAAETDEIEPALVPVVSAATDEAAAAEPAVSPALQQLYASPLWKSYVQQLEESASSESDV